MRAFATIAMVAAMVVLTGCPRADEDDDTAGGPDDDDTTTPDDDTTSSDDDDSAVEQPPIRVGVINGTGAPLYIPWVEWWSDGLNDLLTCAVKVGDAWGSCLYGLPYGVVECDDANLDGYCPGEPDGGSAVLAIEPGQNTEVVWPGTLWVIDTDHCLDGVCANETDPVAGRYAISVIAWTEMGCFFGDCPPPKGGVVWEAYVTGDTTSCYGEIDVPFQADVVELTFE